MLILLTGGEAGMYNNEPFPSKKFQQTMIDYRDSQTDKKKIVEKIMNLVDDYANAQEGWINANPDNIRTAIKNAIIEAING